MTLKRYRWKALNRLKQTQSGFILAESDIQAKQNLLARNLYEIKLQQDWQLRYKVSNAEICDVLNQLATLLDAQIPLKESLHILIQNCSSIPLNQWLRNLLSQLERGFAFSKSIELQGLYLSAQELQLIKVGEMSGKLSYVCSQIAHFRQQQLALQRKIQKILLYPLVVLVISATLTLLLLIFIVPQFAEMYQDNNQDLPFITKFLLVLSHSLTHYIWYIIGVATLTFIFIKKQWRHSIWLYKCAQQLMALMPLISTIKQQARLINFCRSLQLMLNAGIPLQQGLQAFLPQIKTWQNTGALPGDLILVEEVQAILHWIKQGYGFSNSVGSRLFPQQAQQILQVGESSGQLSNILQKIADDYQQQLDHKIDLLSQLLEPFLMLLIGIIIGVIMLGMYLPIFNMGNIM
ncbi:type II secretion system F family protein [[Mannheimia] succiniciproducens]|uniref:type II secretion system F family protein n=1 Tax=[Mannheimia] succiniciproducens TaxID=157673 RepID=UPI0002D97DFD|nr:type II secretion system F family protein [[Mannheimia] succiniciproducens]